MGDAADDILTSLSLTEDERKVYNTVKGKLEQHFVKKRSVIFERAKFNSRVQQQGEFHNIITLSCGTLSIQEFTK